MQQYPTRKRASAHQEVPFHRAGHSINHHPEDEPYTTDERKQTLTVDVSGRHDNRKTKTVDVDETQGYPDYPLAPRRSRTSAYYVPTTDKQAVIRQGNREFIVEKGRPKRRMPWFLLLWMGMLVMLALWLLYSWGSSWWSDHQLYATYGFPRTFQTDAVVGHNDSPANPTHFIFLNLSAHVLIIEIPGGDPAKAKMYSGPIIFDENPTSTPVYGEFKDVGNGKVDMIVHIGNEQIIYLNDGKEFKPQGGS